MSVKVSIAMATHNGAAHLREQLASIAQQTRRPDELIVSDDASRDQTREIVLRFADEVAFPVVLLTNDPALGVAGNFTRAIARCRGELIATCDQDDVWMRDKLANLVVPFADPAVQLAFSDIAICDERAQPTGSTQWQRLAFDHAARARFGVEPMEQLLRFNVVTGMAMMFRASLRGVVLPVPREWIHDEWIAMLAAAVGRLHPVALPLVAYRQHAQQRIGGARSGVIEQVRYARAHMDAAYMRQMALRSWQAAVRLAQHRDRLRRADAVELLRLRAEHYEQRVEPSAGVVWREWRAGNYQRFGYGWKGAVQDLMLR